MNWSNIINTAIGAFLGFFFAYLLEIIIDNKRRKNSIINIKNELEDIKATLEISKNDENVQNEIYTPVWNSVIASGDLLCYMGKPYYNDIIRIYSYIENLKEMEKSINIISCSEQKQRMEIIVHKRNYLYGLLVNLDMNTLK